jgi:hypothetical protein
MGMPVVPHPRSSEIESVVVNYKRSESPCLDQTPAEVNQARGETLRSEIRKLINSTWNKGELRDQSKESLWYQFTKKKKKGDKTDCSNYCGISLLSALYKALSRR